MPRHKPPQRMAASGICDASYGKPLAGSIVHPDQVDTPRADRIRTSGDHTRPGKPSELRGALAGQDSARTARTQNGVASTLTGKVARFAAAGFIAAAAAHGAAAQTENDDATERRAPVQLGPVTVTATANPIQAFDYPGMVSVIRRDDIQILQGSTPDDILSFVPGVEFTGGPRRTGEMPSIRGFDGSDLVILIDGARQNFGSTHDGRFFIDPSLLAGVEVLRGPASSLYGSGATGGVIEFRTVDAADLLDDGQTSGAAVSAGYQSANRERLGTLTYFGRAGAGNELDFIGSVTKRDSGTITLGDGSKLIDADDDILAGIAKAGFALADHQRVEASFLRFDNTAREPNNGQGIGGDPAPGLVDKDIRSDTYRLAYDYSNPANSLLDLDVVVYRTDLKADELRLDDEGAGPRGELLRRDVATTGLRIDNRSRMEISESIAATLTYGAETYRDEQNGAASTGERDGVPDAEAEFRGTFLQSEFMLNDPSGFVPGEALVISGLRYDEFQSSSRAARAVEKSEVSPRLGVSYMPTPWLMAFANYGDDFRAPSINEIYLSGTHFRIPLGRGVITNRFAANPDLKPQRTRTFEIGGGFQFDSVIEPADYLQIKASRFFITGEDFIDQEVIQPQIFGERGPLPQCFQPGACDGTTVATNVANAELDGVEIEAAYESDRLRIALGISTIDGKDKDSGAYLGVLTPDQLTVDMAVKVREIESIVGWRTLAADRFDKVNEPAEERSGYAAHGIYFSWQPASPALAGIRIDLGIDNLFDKAYSRVFTGALEPGRNFKASVGYAVQW